MSDYEDIMVDLETLGNGPNAAILSIGAVAFDLETMSENTFERRISLESSMSHGKADASTIRFWMLQDKWAREALFAEKGTVSLDEALREFSAWAATVSSINKRRIWGNGASFDNVILRAAYGATEIPAPWMYWNDRCFRTLRSLYPNFDLAFEGVKHSALDDAKHQVKHMHAFAAHSNGRLLLDWN